MLYPTLVIQFAIKGNDFRGRVAEFDFCYVGIL